MTVFNFSAGPAVLPVPVLLKAQSELLNYQGSGQSVLELSHRSTLFENILQDTEALLRELLQIPDHYHVLFLQGGATLQFSMLPLNLATNQQRVDFIDTGSWSQKAMQDAAAFVKTGIVASSNADNYRSIPAGPIYSDADYLHLTWNNTLEGTTFTDAPQVDVPLVADFSSSILSEPIDVSQFDVIYAGAQKNLGSAGMTLVIIKDELLQRTPDRLGSYLRYDTHAANHSLYNTPPTYSIYLTKLVLEWIKDQGFDTVVERNHKQSASLYAYLDQSVLFSNHVALPDRSRMNIPFTTGQTDLDKQFLQFAERHHLVNLKGHRSVGGMRASLYNAMPTAGVDALIAILKRFEQGER
ncbi:3-phosphoserine/phosphohydroxythreonine transaminase [Exiguobacterium sp. Helios]|uniref:3-phosphoserine/phosphohydroxythreonine transaminase n=1 Tax=Exiguobacterium sp. Helios TaxID=2735868 RepID=UPI00165DE597|nr:3-phosphoserine/phosphohydroxythreonine transaminase [Exiguobacterium sp. Helios]QNR21287.1 3-phosphoserine/phosphohydroxythreonine transaminase [Exiguobacterium sp. Helios]